MINGSKIIFLMSIVHISNIRSQDIPSTGSVGFVIYFMCFRLTLSSYTFASNTINHTTSLREMSLDLLTWEFRLAGGLFYTSGVLFFALDHWYPWTHAV
jgi:hypothetical protein